MKTVMVSIEEILRAGAIRSVYQPIVELDTRTVVAFEALSRGPIDSPLAQPDQLFAAAALAGRTGELDRLCLASALSNAPDQLPAGSPLFVNVEPSTLSTGLIEGTAPIAAFGNRTIVLEVTERALAEAPAQLIAGVAEARERGWLIALDDVGVEPESLAFLPVIRPDVVKLDLGLIQDRPGRELGRTMTTVMAYAERTGATILAEGIESARHLDRAMSLGATLAQGFYFGLPAERFDHLDVLPWFAAPRTRTSQTVALSPFDAVTSAGHPTRVARKDVLLQISRHLEEQALADPGAPLLLSAFQDVRHFTRATGEYYSRLSEQCALVAALGVSMPREPSQGVRGAAIYPGDPLEGEWSVVVLGPHYSGALRSKDLGDLDTTDADRRFSYVVTHDRAAVELAAHSLLRRVATQL